MKNEREEIKTANITGAQPSADREKHSTQHTRPEKENEERSKRRSSHLCSPSSGVTRHATHIEFCPASEYELIGVSGQTKVDTAQVTTTTTVFTILSMTLYKQCVRLRAKRGVT